MEKDSTIISNESGYVLVTSIIVTSLLVVLGFVGMTTSSFEILIAGNDKRIREDFFYTEGSGIETSGDVNLLGSMTTADCNATSRTSCLNSYAVTDISTKALLTTTEYSPSTTVNQTRINNITDPNWPVNYIGMYYGAPGGFQSREYAYRVFYWGMGPNPKGYGTDYASFIFDITARKQNTEAGAITRRGATIDQGFIKIGPKPGT